MSLFTIWEDFVWGIRPLVEWLIKYVSILETILAPFRVTSIEEKKEVLVLEPDAIQHMDTKTQKLLGTMQAQVEVLKQQREFLIKKLYQDKVLNIGKELNQQLSTLANSILMKGELTLYKELPTAISADREEKAIGMLLAISRYQSRYYPIVISLVDGEIKFKVMTQGVNSTRAVVRSMTYDRGGNPIVFLSYDSRGKYVPQSYVRVS